MKRTTIAILLKYFIRKGSLCWFLLFLLPYGLHAQQTIVQYLSGTDKDHTVPWEFKCTHGRNSGQWSTIPVPSCWEMQGFGTYNYSEDKINPDEQGFYRHHFSVAPKHKGKRIFIVFDAAMTDTEIKINGRFAGPTHQGGFYQFKYDITNLVQYDSANLLEVSVRKRSANASVNHAERQADFWLFGGIFRPVYLEMVPATFIERVAIDARASGDFRMQVFSNADASQAIEAQVFDLRGQPVEQPFQLAKGDSVLQHHFTNIRTWNPEQPNLYYVTVSLKEGAQILHTVRQRFGFRTAELRRQDGFYVNGTKVIFKGVCRHSEWPETGRTLSRAVHLLDIKLMKGMNMNAVRMSHYPPDKEFLDLCDSLGLFVLDELTGWQAAYDTTIGRKLVKELVVRDVNHPSIVIWDNGNEGGWNRALDNDFQLYDPQQRLVIHPWERFNGTNTHHYPDFTYVQKEVATYKDVFFPTEFMHGLFDGGHGAGLEDFWNTMLQHPQAAGGFLWSLHDEGVVRADWHDSIDVAGNRGPDGIVGPHREKEASYYTIKELWSPVYIDSKAVVPTIAGTNIKITNRYLYTNLNQCRFEWKGVTFSKTHTTATTIVQEGSMQAPALAPGTTGTLRIPALKKPADAFYLTAIDAKGDTICTWSWALKSPQTVINEALPIIKQSGIKTKAAAQLFILTCDRITYIFDKTTGLLQQVSHDKKAISISGGPASTSGTQSLKQFRHYQQKDEYVIEPIYTGNRFQVKWIFQSGRLPKLEYSYTPLDTTDYLGITFQYPEAKITGMTWQGRGPYRVWKNRLKGQQYGVWQKAYNNTVTGESWNYPEFKGWYADLRWVTLQTTEGSFTVYAGQPNCYLQMLQPQKPKAAFNNYTSPPFPDASIGFMHAISAIGTKFQPADVMGPQSQRPVYHGSTPLKGVLYFDFR